MTCVIAVWVAVGATDFLTTLMGLGRGGQEGNPLQAFCLHLSGSLWPGMALGLLLLPVALLALRRFAPRLVLAAGWAANAARAGVVASNCLWLHRGGL